MDIEELEFTDPVVDSEQLTVTISTDNIDNGSKKNDGWCNWCDIVRIEQKRTHFTDKQIDTLFGILVCRILTRPKEKKLWADVLVDLAIFLCIF